MLLCSLYTSFVFINLSMHDRKMKAKLWTIRYLNPKLKEFHIVDLCKARKCYKKRRNYREERTRSNKNYEFASVENRISHIMISEQCSKKILQSFKPLRVLDCRCWNNFISKWTLIVCMCMCIVCSMHGGLYGWKYTHTHTCIFGNHTVKSINAIYCILSMSGM